MPQKFQAVSCNGQASFIDLCLDKKIFTLDEGYIYYLRITPEGKLVLDDTKPDSHTRRLVYFTISNPYKYNLLIYGFDNGIEYLWEDLKGVSKTGDYYVPWCTVNTQSFIEIQVEVEPLCEGKCPGYCPGNQICMAGYETYSCIEPEVPCTECGGACYGVCSLGQTCVVENNAYKCIACQECSGNCKGPCPEGQECQLVSGQYTCVQKCTSCENCLGPCPEGQECQLVSGQYTCVGQDLCGCPSGEKCVINSDGSYICEKEKEKTKFPWWGWLLVSLGILIVLIILGFIIYKITRNKNAPEIPSDLV